MFLITIFFYLTLGKLSTIAQLLAVTGITVNTSVRSNDDVKVA